jgi:predicted nicotinamide N-methyase
VKVHVADVATYEERGKYTPISFGGLIYPVKLFAHFVWNASILAADLISNGTFAVVNETVLELGAGAGLAGIVAALHRANLVVLSDYDSPKLLENLQRNVDSNIPPTGRERVKVVGHIWGQDTTSITKYRLLHNANQIDFKNPSVE